MNFKKLVLGVLLILIASHAMAQSQQVRVGVDTLSEGRYQANVYYQPSDGRRTTGLGIRVHYSSNAIKVDSTSQVLAGVTGLQVQSDTANFDNRVATDQFFSAAWFDLNSNWPASLNGEVLLFSINFSLVNPTVASSLVFNVTRVSTAAGYELQASNFTGVFSGGAGSAGGGSGGTGNSGGSGATNSATVTEAIRQAREELASAPTPEAILNAVKKAALSISQTTASADAGMLASARSFVDDTVRAGVRHFHAGNATLSDQQIRTLLTQNPAAIDFALASAIVLSGNWKADPELLGEAMLQRGVNANIGARLAGSMQAIQALNTIDVGSRSAESVLSDSLGNAASISTDSITGLADMQLPLERYKAAVLATRLVGDLLPEGLSFLVDGRALFVSNGFAFELAPQPADLLGFIAAVERESFAYQLRENGAFDLDLGAGEHFSGALGYDNLSDLSGACGAISIKEPQGALNSPQYAFEISCANGARQRVTPFVHDSAFYTTMASNAAKLATDRNTGIISIETVGRFKPGFFVRPLSPQEQVYLSENGSAGVAIQTQDVNGDGINDMVFMSAAGAQPLYGMAP